MMKILFERLGLLYKDIINTYKKRHEIIVQPNLDAFMFMEPFELFRIQLILESYNVHPYVNYTPYSIM